MPAQELIEQGERRRVEIERFIKEFWLEHGYSPSIIEIGEAVGILSPNAVRAHLQRMASEGIIRMDPGVPRSIRLTGYELVKKS